MHMLEWKQQLASILIHFTKLFYDTLYHSYVAGTNYFFVQDSLIFTFGFCMPGKKNKYLLVWFLSLAIVLGPAYTLFDNYNYDFVENPDIETYMGLASFDFDQSPVRRYRVLVPFAAAGVNFILSPILDRVQPWTFPGPDFSLGFSFLLVNSILVALCGLLVFQLCQQFGISVPGSILGSLSFLTCRWTAYAAGLPLVDSLYLLVIIMVLLAIKTRRDSLIILAIMLGPWAKESFIFIAPLIFFFHPMKKGKLLFWFVLSGAIVFSFRYAFDQLNGFSASESIQKDLGHFDQIGPSLQRLFSFHGLYEILSIIGLWGAGFLLLIKKEFRISLKQLTPVYFYFFLGIVLVHALLSYDLARMFFLATPLLAVWYGKFADDLVKKSGLQFFQDE